MSGSRFLYGLLFVLLLCFWFVAYRYGGETENVSAQSTLLGALLIFLLRLSDMTLDTLRLMFTMRGHKWLTAFVGFMQAAIVIVAITNGPRPCGNARVRRRIRVRNPCRGDLQAYGARHSHRRIIRRRARRSLALFAAPRSRRRSAAPERTGGVHRQLHDSPLRLKTVKSLAEKSIRPPS
jgi:hypothetical protein